MHKQYLISFGYMIYFYSVLFFDLDTLGTSAKWSFSDTWRYCLGYGMIYFYIEYYRFTWGTWNNTEKNFSSMVRSAVSVILGFAITFKPSTLVWSFWVATLLFFSSAAEKPDAQTCNCINTSFELTSEIKANTCWRN